MSGIYTVTSPDVPGLVTEGCTPAEILADVQDALDGLMEAWRELEMEITPALRPVLADRPQTVFIPTASAPSSARIARYKRCALIR